MPHFQARGEPSLQLAGIKTIHPAMLSLEKNDGVIINQNNLLMAAAYTGDKSTAITLFDD
ncbi:hypothetical protein FHW67_003140 [Herbaspirillum sp. Sphag1AN]|uniref:hypothetical protein n=1 Tax=unclassified Herbaspirillum TaxID=2624150 RepID=UPI00160CE2DF|nr:MULTISPECIES: hypothetical protein [unclassified Herbaspirillum]MBB3213834.1 hypothetical protein [Herbaspirillum sp. Sphag1AN]MBB3247031.1 hypothetical protein [Herbaspirillum sp. Sphag64]